MNIANSTENKSSRKHNSQWKSSCGLIGDDNLNVRRFALSTRNHMWNKATLTFKLWLKLNCNTSWSKHMHKENWTCNQWTHKQTQMQNWHSRHAKGRTPKPSKRRVGQTIVPSMVLCLILHKSDTFVQKYWIRARTETIMNPERPVFQA